MTWAALRSEETAGVGEPMRHGLAGSKAAGGTRRVLLAGKRLPADRGGESHANGGLDGASEGSATRRAPPRRPRAPGCLR